ncbi:NAD(P)/FAD-dependent oxidoreductase [Oleiharenicola lentus]|jgi:predicted Rossmann fold flavoprotein|uniref:NAD(P)/FAD-dependent oxidoreductase n=1 Tax=Oleiharenicola lentus TaxID=2508720 RepID=A0A4Q1C7I9_9BACT|nr:NAD(P)/FAD-dependent oxidoreductase [Oleiharenicola lentus]RXK54790.1 NAD(P)/FAD-dependent oxidoreductase [Oleiharenicola lentus]
MQKRHIAVVGGGAAGFFAAITAAEASPDCVVTIYEATAHLLAKVKVSGGGRCNVTHACFEPRELVKRYPRGGRELLGAFSRWQPRDTVEWFEARGVKLKTEEDGRMFPVTDSSQTIIDCLMGAARTAGVVIRTSCGVKQVDGTLRAPSAETAREAHGPPFTLRLTTGETVTADRVLLAAGGNRSNAGFTIAAQFGHTIEPTVPSLFTFNIKDPRLTDLAGVSVEEAATEVVGQKALRERGPVLVTHWGLSGPGILKLSAWGARTLSACGYKFTLRVNWAPRFNPETARAALEQARAANPKKQLTTWSPLGVPSRLWERLVVAAGLAPDAIWTGVGNPALRALAAQVCEAEFAVDGKSTFKDEFVTCGGVRLGEVDFKTMESRLVPGLHFAGEFLDVDGITGGFNFQNAWTTGRLAGLAMAGG